jgi:phenylalanyl-tRNA synthetase beta chain
VDRGGKPYSATVHYYDGHREVTPNFDPGCMELGVEYANKVLGLRLAAKQMTGLLERGGFGVERVDDGRISVQVPCYRIDIMHPVDLVEDVAIAFGYENIMPSWRKLPTVGGARPEQGFLDVARELMVGLGFQEVLSYNMTGPDGLFRKMNLRKRRVIELANPKVQTLTCLRSWLLPGLMEFFGCNLHVEYPQRVFELGTVTVPDGDAETRTRDDDVLAAAVSSAQAGYTEIKSVLEAFLMNLGLRWEVRETEHASFIRGRVGSVVVGKTEVGVLGELHPKVLCAWGLENPVAGLELNMSKIGKVRGGQ